MIPRAFSVDESNADDHSMTAYNGLYDSPNATGDYRSHHDDSNFPLISPNPNGHYIPRRQGIQDLLVPSWVPSDTTRLSAPSVSQYAWEMQSAVYPQIRAPSYSQSAYNESFETLTHDTALRNDFLSHMSTAYSPPESPGIHPFNNCMVPALSVHQGDHKFGVARSQSPPECLSPKEQSRMFRQARDLGYPGAGPFIPQAMYKPHTNSDRRRYVELATLEQPIYFRTGEINWGIPLIDALHSKVRDLQDKNELLFDGRGPSISIRLEWPGYRQWSRQIPTRDFKTPPGPINKAKLAKNVAKCVQRFIEENKRTKIEEDGDGDAHQWVVGTTPDTIMLEDLILVSMHHVSMGSWQPQLRLRRLI
ncbi:hypothetical protein AX16_001398 [Volvariella volvacea WC 439]|nr:hypothetical protein AX16_001398 [Volvariella volvacea WC 439]